jgi:Flp pilus assembly pilin Flp
MIKIAAGWRRLRRWPARVSFQGLTRLDGFAAKDRGATATEYAILVSLIAVVIVTGVAFFGHNLNDWYHRLGAHIGPYTS